MLTLRVELPLREQSRLVELVEAAGIESCAWKPVEDGAWYLRVDTKEGSVQDQRLLDNLSAEGIRHSPITTEEFWKSRSIGF